LDEINPQAAQHYKIREYGYKNKMLDIASKKEILMNDLVHHYSKAYSIHHNISKNLVQAYLKEIKWIFNYYAYGSATVNWETYYPSQFAPTALDLVESEPFCPDCEVEPFNLPLSPFFQLLCILPPHSADLLPPPLDRVLREEMDHFHPKEVKIDYDGKLNDWEGIPILPPLNYEEILSIYEANVNLCSKTDLKKNKVSKQLKISIV
jgi:5'-3' exonuclease